MPKSLPSASKSAQLIACQWWVTTNPADAAGSTDATEDDSDDAPNGASEAARYGSAFHEAIAQGLKPPKKPKALIDIAARWGIDVKELVPHVAEAFQALSRWLRRSSIDAAAGHVEYPVALTIHGNADAKHHLGRRCSPHDEATHVYPDADYSRELPGTIDFYSARPKMPVLIDHKTGADTELPSHSAQLKTLARAVVPPQKGARLVIFHSPRQSVSTVYEDEVSADTLAGHHEELRDAYYRIGDGSLRPGPWCTYCSARLECPTSASALVQLGVKPSVLLLETPEDIGRAHQGLELYSQLARSIKDIIRRRLQNGEVGLRPDGKIVTLATREVERLSKKSFIDVLGAAKGEAALQKLRDAGVLKKVLEPYMRAEPDQGGKQR